MSRAISVSIPFFVERGAEEIELEGTFTPEIPASFRDPGEPEECEIERCVDADGKPYALTDAEEESALGAIREAACDPDDEPPENTVWEDGRPV